MPLLGVVLFLVALGAVAVARWTEGRTHDEMKSTSTRYRRFAFVMEMFFGSATAFWLAIAVLLFGNPYVLNLGLGLTAS